MKPPKTQNDPGGVAAPTGAENDQMAAEDKATVAHRTDVRHAPGQTPIARFLLVHEHRAGRRRADAWPLDHCPMCGYHARHSAEWPPPETLWKSCTSCGHRELYATIAVKAGSRTRRAAR